MKGETLHSDCTIPQKKALQLRSYDCLENMFLKPRRGPRADRERRGEGEHLRVRFGHQRSTRMGMGVEMEDLLHKQ